MKKFLLWGILVLVPLAVFAENKPLELTLRGSAGTDASLGFAYGVGVYHKVLEGATNYEIGVNFYGSNSTEVSEEYGSTYTEKTNLLIVTVMFNYLHNYDPKGEHIYLISGVGAGVINYDYTQSSLQDTSLGTPYLTGSIMYRDDTVFGNMLNLGVGKILPNGLDIRVEIPMFVMYSSYTGSSAIAIALTASVGKAFSF